MDGVATSLSKNRSAKNLIHKWLINLLNNFEDDDDFAMSDTDVFKPDFEFDCGSSGISPSWKHESPYYTCLIQGNKHDLFQQPKTEQSEKFASELDQSDIKDDSSLESPLDPFNLN